MARRRWTTLQLGLKRWLQFGLRVLLGMGAIIILALVWQHIHLQQELQRALLWVQDLGPKGVIAFVVIYNLATVLFIPGSLLTLGAGALYGVIWGSIYATIAAMLGATLAFLIGRYCARGWVSQYLQRHPRFQAIDQAVAKEGLKIVFLTRLSPVFPFNLLNYTFGVTCISLRDYIIGSTGIIPGNILYVYLGALAGDAVLLGMPQQFSPEAQGIRWIVKTLGFLATLAVMIYGTSIAKKALDK